MIQALKLDMNPSAGGGLAVRGDDPTAEPFDPMLALMVAQMLGTLQPAAPQGAAPQRPPALPPRAPSAEARPVEAQAPVDRPRVVERREPVQEAPRDTPEAPRAPREVPKAEREAAGERQSGQPVEVSETPTPIEGLPTALPTPEVEGPAAPVVGEAPKPQVQTPSLSEGEDLQGSTPVAAPERGQVVQPGAEAPKLRHRVELETGTLPPGKVHRGTESTSEPIPAAPAVPVTQAPSEPTTPNQAPRAPGAVAAPVEVSGTPAPAMPAVPVEAPRVQDAPSEAGPAVPKAAAPPLQESPAPLSTERPLVAPQPHPSVTPVLALQGREAAPAQVLIRTAPEPRPSVGAILPASAPVAEVRGATSTLPSPPRAMAHPVLAQVDGTIRWILRKQEQGADLQLHPESLGKVQIKLTVEGQQVHAQVWASEPSTVPILREHLAFLDISLREQGLSLGQFQLQQGDRHQEAAFAHRGSQTAFPDASPLRAEASQDAPRPSPVPLLGTYRIHVLA